MARKWFIVVPLVAAELALCAGILAVFWGGYRWVQDNGLRLSAFAANNVSAEVDESQTLPVSGPATLTLANTAGDVTVTGGPGSAIVISAHKTAWGVTQAEADAALADLKVTVTQTGDVITIKVVQPAQVTLVGDQRTGSVDFTLTVPDGAALKLHTDFGDVSLDHASASTVDASTSSGAVRLQQVQATGAVTLGSDFGSLRFEDGAADRLTATTSSGGVTLLDLTVAGSVEAHSDFGDLSVVRVAAAGGYTLGTSSGAVTLTGATGSVTAESGFGNITITDAEAVTLDAHSSSGSVTFAGSLGAGPNRLRTDFGDIVLRLPADATATFDLGTDFGSIHSDFPVTLSGDLDATNWQGTLGGGGPRLTVHTSSGSIRLETLAA